MSYIQFEKALTQEQKEKSLVSHYEDHLSKVEKAHTHPLYMEVKRVMNFMKKDILLEYKRKNLTSSEGT